ncbi:MAG: 50S ribosomal protein L29 [Dehalococcoidia bacterium]|nr:50S ribosomal protein L29 [Dehalococcoidia bacterium]
MKVEKIRALKPKELSNQLNEAYQELFNLRFRHATRQLSNYKELTHTRRKIARIKTIMRERELAGK